MLKKNGFTLIEVLVSVMILGIVGILLATSFGKVIHFMSKSNNVKTSSNEMYSFFENGLNGTISSSFKRNSTGKVSYGIVSGGTNITVSGTMTNLESTLENDVFLNNIDYEDRMILQYDESYKTFKSEFGDSIYKNTQKNTETCGFNRCNKESDFYAYISVLNKNGALPVFDNEYLPVSLRDGKEYYVRICYPWKVETNTFSQPLVYVTPKNNDYVKDENIQIIYDYINAIWYYQPAVNTYYMAQGGNHEMDLSSSAPYKIDIAYSGIVLNSYDDFMKQVKNPIYGWQVLNDNAKVGDYVNYWKKVE